MKTTTRLSIFAGAALVALLVWQASGIATQRPEAPAPTDSATLQNEVIAEGRVVTYPGAQVIVGTETGGRIVRLPVEEKMAVKRGDLIAELDSSELRAAVLEAKARIAEADADIRYHRFELDRFQAMAKSHVASQQELEQTRQALDAAQARREGAVASVERLEAMIAKTRIVAPIEGVITTRQVHAGEVVEASTHLVTIADLSRLRIEAEVDEYDVGRMVLGAEVKVTAEGFSNRSWKGRVEEIPDTVTPRRLKPEDPGRPSDTRVLLVKVSLMEQTPLKLGQRVEVQIVVPKEVALAMR